MIAIIDYDAGNLKSLSNALKKNNISYEIISNPKSFENFTHFILPGVGSYSEAINELKKRNFDKYISDIFNNNIPMLGICLGMQLFSNYGYEDDKSKGLGIIDGNVISINNLNPSKNIHVGWNNVNLKQDSKIFKRLWIRYYFITNIVFY